MHVKVRQSSEEISQSATDSLLQLIFVLVAKADAKVVGKPVQGNRPVRASTSMHRQKDVFQFHHDLGHLLVP